MTAPDRRSEAVGDFYDHHHDAFLRVYGNVIQAFRTRDPKLLLDHEARRMGLVAGQRVLDAGCGIAAPAIHFAQGYGVEVEALTISKRQEEDAQRAIEAARCTQSVRVTRGDYHRLSEIYPKDHFDIACFLESFGHAHDKEAVLRGCLDVLRPGGSLYVKDLFAKEPVLEKHREPIRREIARINAAYHYNISDLTETITMLRRLGYILADLSTIDLPLQEFENLTISNDFQELTGIARIENWAEYVFPVDFFEIRCFKPWHGPDVGSSRYFLQNLYHLRVMGDRLEDL